MIGLVKRIKVVTGWNIPELEEDRSILYAEMYCHFQESWPSYNAEEIAYSVRAYGNTVNNWGKDINLILIDQCLESYQRERLEASKMEEQKTPTSAPRLPPPSDWREMLEYYFQKFLTGLKINIWMMPFEMYGQAVTDRYVAPEVWMDFTEKATEWLFRDFSRQESLFVVNRDKVAKKEIELKFEAFIEQGEQYEDVPRIAKRLALLFLFEKLKASKVANMYVYEPNQQDEDLQKK